MVKAADDKKKNKKADVAGGNDKKKAKKSDDTKTKAAYPTSKATLAADAARWRAKKRDDGEKKLLDVDFFGRGTVAVCKDLLGKVLTVGDKSAYIIETEAYRADEEEAAHGYTSRATKGRGTRAELVWGAPAVFYVYSIHQCCALDFTCEPAGVSGCALIRAVRNVETGEAIYGPGRVCAHFGITVASHNGVFMAQAERKDVSAAHAAKRCFVSDHGVDAGAVKAGPRVGISKAKDLQWRFTCE